MAEASVPSAQKLGLKVRPWHADITCTERVRQVRGTVGRMFSSRRDGNQARNEFIRETSL